MVNRLGFCGNRCLCGHDPLRKGTEVVMGGGTGGKRHHGLTVAHGFAEHFMLTNWSGRNMSGEFAADRPQNVVRKLAAIAVQRGNDADGKLSPHLIGKGADGGNLPLGAAEGKEAGFHRNECLVSGAERVKGQVADGGRAIDDASVKVWRHAFEVPQESSVAVRE